ncbi:hypothetical protein [Limnoglobus roseus]|nr:hypothetical protein [Limnoglobus roseus]
MSTDERNNQILSVMPWANDIITRRAGQRPDLDDIRQDCSCDC